MRVPVRRFLQKSLQPFLEGAQSLRLDPAHLSPSEKFLFESFPCGVVVTTNLPEISFANKQAQKHLPLSAAPIPTGEHYQRWCEALGLLEVDKVTMIPPHRNPFLAAHFGKSIQTTDLYVSKGLLHRGRILRIKSSPLIDSAGELIGNLICTTDISSTYARLLSAQETNRFFETLYYSVPLPLGVSNLDEKRFVYANQRFLDRLGWNRASLFANGFEEMLWNSAKKRKELVEKLDVIGRLPAQRLEFRTPYDRIELAASFHLVAAHRRRYWLWILDERTGSGRRALSSEGAPTPIPRPHLSY